SQVAGAPSRAGEEAVAPAPRDPDLDGPRRRGAVHHACLSAALAGGTARLAAPGAAATAAWPFAGSPLARPVGRTTGAPDPLPGTRNLVAPSAGVAGAAAGGAAAPAGAARPAGASRAGNGAASRQGRN